MEDNIILPDEAVKIEQQIISENICSIKIGTPAKGGEVKIYFNPDKPDEALLRVVTSCQLNKVTQDLHNDPFNDEKLKQAEELLLKKKKQDSETATEKKPEDLAQQTFNAEVHEALNKPVTEDEIMEVDPDAEPTME